jgi:hypothetical protein
MTIRATYIGDGDRYWPGIGLVHPGDTIEVDRHVLPHALLTATDDKPEPDKPAPRKSAAAKPGG